MQKLPDFVPAFSHHLKPLMRDGSQFTGMLFHPRIDGGIPLDSAVESQQFCSHHLSTFCFRELWLRNGRFARQPAKRSEEHTSELQSRPHLVCRLLLEKKKKEREMSAAVV